MLAIIVIKPKTLTYPLELFKLKSICYQSKFHNSVIAIDNILNYESEKNSEMNKYLK